MRPTPFLIAVAFVSITQPGPTAQDAGEASASPDLPLEPARTLSLDTDEGSWNLGRRQPGRRDHRL